MKSVDFTGFYTIDLFANSHPLKRAGPPECVKIELPDGRRIITTENSEIRTSGRNHRKIFTKNLFMNVLDQMNTVEIDKDKYNEVVLFKKESMYI